MSWKCGTFLSEGISKVRVPRDSRSWFIILKFLCSVFLLLCCFEVYGCGWLKVFIVCSFINIYIYLPPSHYYLYIYLWLSSFMHNFKSSHGCLDLQLKTKIRIIKKLWNYLQKPDVSVLNVRYLASNLGVWAVAAAVHWSEGNQGIVLNTAAVKNLSG